MGHIAQLPEAVFNSLRSSTILSDFAQIVEELISNSIDAGSTKVHVSIDVGSSYIKVEDDGCGIKRDDLSLVGERHATSKLHSLAELNAGVQTLGFRGEALSSLSDVALLEVTTRARGSPNTYTKILKGCKCLSLGISHRNRGLGTTVIVRDVFYNQPVRRRLFQSSPKKLLQSVREHVLRIALIRPQVAFNVIDLEREEEVIHTVPATSPICILRSFFGNEFADNLQGIDFSKGKLRLSGFISRSPNQLSSKAVQYFYINSRFVRKTPIHKLLNKSSTEFSSIFTLPDHDLDQLERENESADRDTSERHLYPVYVLNLSCPLSDYDITYEVSKTVVEFKDWPNVIAFVDEALQQTWEHVPANSSHGASRFGLSQNITKSVPKKQRTWQHIDPSYRHLCKAQARKSSKSDPHMSATDVCNKRKQREVLEPFSEISHVQMHPRIRPKSNEATEITCDSLEWSPPYRCGSNEANDSVLQTDIFSVESTKEDCNGYIQTEHKKLVSTSDQGTPDGKQIKFSTMSTLLNVYDDEVQSSLYNENTYARSKHELADNILATAYSPAFSYEKLLSGEFRFNQDNGEHSNSNVAYLSRKLHFSSDDEHLLPSEISCSFLSPVIKGRSMQVGLTWDALSKPESADKIVATAYSPAFSYERQLSGEFRVNQDKKEHCNSNAASLSRKHHFSSDDEHSLHSEISCSFLSPVIKRRSILTRKQVCHKWDDGDHGSYKEMDWPKSQECLQNYDLISEDVSPSVITHPTITPEPCIYYDVDFWDANNGNHLIRNGFVRLDQENGSFKDIYGENTRDVETTSFVDDSDAPFRDSWLYFEDDLGLYQSNVRTTGKEVKVVNPRQKGIHECQPDAFSLKSIEFSNIYIPLHKFGLDHSSSNKLREMDAAVSVYGEADDCSQNAKLGYDMELESKRGHCGSPKPIKRSLSAPPFYRSRKKFGLHINPPSSLSTITSNCKHLSDCSKRKGASFLQDDTKDILLPDHSGVPLSDADFRDIQGSNWWETGTQEEKEPLQVSKPSELLLLQDNSNSVQGVLPSPIPLSVSECEGDLVMEWKQSYTRQNCEDGVLNVSSGALYLANSSLIPKSITKECFMKANILQQVDRKYIAIVAQGNLAVVDQHAADERIRLEQLRKEVLEREERKKVTFLDYEEELMLPVGGVQLLRSYNDQIEQWGWRYKIVSQNEGSFRRKAHQLHRSSCKAILTAVPCILGVNLTAEDLSEYIQQLVQTDGSSAPPPAVLRILNFKACRGAIMFGDVLLQSECSLLVEELKKTSLCFQCAHGRPTIVPLVNLEALHKQLKKIDKLSQSSERILNKSKTAGNASLYPIEGWHGLRKHRPTIERAKMRLN